jgi:hypothetical protein
MTASPTFASIQEHIARIGSVGFWWPYVAEIWDRHDLADARQVPVAGSNATWPTFLHGAVVVKLFGYRDRGARITRPNARRRPWSPPTRRSPRPDCWARGGCTTTPTRRGIPDQHTDVRGRRAGCRVEPRPPLGLTVVGHRRVGHRSSSIGIRTPRSCATSTARSYPASAWRITPMPGSVVRTLSKRPAASSEPSATTTIPAWIE